MPVIQSVLPGRDTPYRSGGKIESELEERKRGKAPCINEK
jgi:hypothetical protein